MWRSKSFLARLAQVFSAIRIISTIIPNSSAASYRDLTALIVYIERNTCLMCVLTCVESILVITFTLSMSVKFWEHKYTYAAPVSTCLPVFSEHKYNSDDYDDPDDDNDDNDDNDMTRMAAFR